MLTKSQKAEVIKNLNEKLSGAQAVFLTNLIGLPSNDANAIRKGVRDANGNMFITRNTLFKLAAKGTAAEELLSDLKGANAVAIAGEEAPAVAKVLYDAGKEFEQVTLTRGVLDGQTLETKDLEALAKLPSKDQMLATLLATFNAPVSAFVRVMDAIQRQKEEGGAPAEAEAAPAE